MRKITTEQWADLDGIKRSIDDAAISHLSVDKVEQGPLDDRSFYLLCTAFLFMYKRLKEYENESISK